MNSEINLEAFITFCDEMMIVEEAQLQLPTDKYLPALIKNPIIQANIFDLSKRILSIDLKDKNMDDLVALYDSYFPEDRLTHIINYHTNKMVVSGILRHKTKDEIDNVFFHGEKNGEFLLEGNYNNKIKIKRRLQRMLASVFKGKMIEVLNFHYSNDRKLINRTTGRYEYGINCTFKKDIGSVYVKDKDEFIDTSTVRIVLGKDSEYSDPYVVTMYPVILDKKEK